MWVDDATGTVHQVKAPGAKEMEMQTVDADGRAVKKRKILLDVCLEGGPRAQWGDVSDGRDLIALSGGRCEWQSRGRAHVHKLVWTKLQ